MSWPEKYDTMNFALILENAIILKYDRKEPS